MRDTENKFQPNSLLDYLASWELLRTNMKKFSLDELYILLAKEATARRRAHVIDRLIQRISKLQTIEFRATLQGTLKELVAELDSQVKAEGSDLSKKVNQQLEFKFSFKED